MTRLLAILLLFSSTNLMSLEVDHNGYLRTGTGTNFNGGDQVCLRNPGTGGNEFRLGNECGVYGELGVIVKHVPKTKNGFFNTNIMFAFNPDNHTNWEVPSSFVISQGYVEGGKFNGSKLSYWIGNRYYRLNSSHINDWFYFANASGNGAGVQHIKFPVGHLDLAILKETGTTTSDEAGTHAVTLYDARIKNIDLGNKKELTVWLGFATSPGGEDMNQTGGEYDSSTGLVVQVLHSMPLLGGNNNFSMGYGKGLLDEFSLGGDSSTLKGSTDHTSQKYSKRIRIVEDYTFNFTEWSLHGILSYENRDNGATVNNHSDWYSVGFRPKYFINDHYQLVAEAGFSQVDRDGSAPQRLTRLTIAPTFSIDNSFFGRPVLRAFYTRSYWSRSNRGLVTSSRPYENETSGGSYGFQAEVWF